MKIISKDYRTAKTRKKENTFSCNLKNNPYLYKFACRLLFNVIKLAKKVGYSDDELLEFIQMKRFNPVKGAKTRKIYSRLPPPDFMLKKNVILKNGYTCKNYDCKELLNQPTWHKLYEWNKKYDIQLLQITSAMYKFQMENRIITYCIQHNPALKERIIKTFRKYFHVPESFGFNDLENLVKKSEGFWFYPWLLFFMDSPIKNLMHRNLNEDKDYIRLWKRKLETPKNIYTTTLKKSSCLKKQFNTRLTNVITGNTYMNPIYNGIWWNVMREYKKQILAGPSSSSVIFYEFMFNITNLLPKNRETKIKALALVLADYYPIHHSISEVLQLYTEDAHMPPYSLKMDDVEYCKSLFKTVPELKDLSERSANIAE